MRKKIWLAAIVLLLFVFVYWSYATNKDETNKSADKKEARIVPVEVAPVEKGNIELIRTFTGAVEAMDEFVIAPKISGRVIELNVDLSDQVARGQVVARLDNDEYIQAVRQARADLAVANANLAEANSLVSLTDRELKRIEKLRKKGVASETQLDAAKREALTREAAKQVAVAQLSRAQAQLETSEIRLGYTEVKADWRTESEGLRVVAERLIDEGETVSANTPLLRIVALNPVKAVFYVSETSYARLKAGQAVKLSTDAYPDREFAAQIARIAPVFQESTRQAQVELTIDNPDHLLKPGMYVRAQVILDEKLQVTIVPESALLKRKNQWGVFSVSSEGTGVAWTPVNVGIRNNERVEISATDLGERVVVLGQHLLSNQSRVIISTVSQDSGL